MGKERIYKSRVYFIEVVPGISGFQRWNEREYGIASGATVKSRGLKVGMPPGIHGDLNAGQRFRLDDGHLPEFQPRATYDRACSFVLEAQGHVAWILPSTSSKAATCSTAKEA